MAGAERARRAAGSAVALLLTVAALPGAVQAAEGNELQTLPGPTVAALPIDVDHDGAAELLRLMDASPASGLVLEIWDIEDGTWGLVDRTPVAVLDNPTGEVGALLRASIDGQARPVLVTGQSIGASDLPPTVCCVELDEIVLTGDGLELRPIETDELRAEFLAFSDLDGDGTDELITQVTVYHDMNDDGLSRLEVHRRDEGRFDRIHSMEEEGGGPGIIVADGDDRPGGEVYLQTSTLGQIRRLVLVDGAIVEESGHVDLGQPNDGWIGSIGNGRIVMQQAEAVQVLEWSRGADPRELGRLETFEFPLVMVMGEGSDAILVVDEGFNQIPGSQPRVTVYDLELRELGTLERSADAARLWDEARQLIEMPTERLPLYPYNGPLPGHGSPASWGYVTNGMLLEAGGPDGFTTTEVSPMLGVVPIGRVGPDHAWLALGQGYGYFGGYYGYFGGYNGGNGSATYLFPYGPVPPDSGGILMALADEALRPAGALATVAIDGAVEGERDGEPVLLAPPDGFRLLVDGPSGAVAVMRDGGRRTELELGNGPVEIEVALRGNRRDRNVDFDRTLLVVTPDGRAQIETWTGTFVLEAPEVTAHADTKAFELESRIYGRASEGVSVTVNGSPVTLNANGAYSVRVDAFIWPTDVVIVARDLLGNEATQRIEVVGFLDYRGLPWVPIFGLATVAAGAFLFVRTPRRREVDAPTWGDARLEEIDGDSV